MIYNEIQGVPAFHVGDKVIVMRNTEMAYSWLPDMDLLDGIETEIKYADWDRVRNCYLYITHADSRYVFDASCFILAPDNTSNMSFEFDNSTLDKFLNTFACAK